LFYCFSLIFVDGALPSFDGKCKPFYLSPPLGAQISRRGRKKFTSTLEIFTQYLELAVVHIRQEIVVASKLGGIKVAT